MMYPTATLEEVWALFKETDRKFEEITRKFEETDIQFKETDRRFKETDLKFQETDRKFQETDRKFQELSQHTDQEITRMSKEIGKLGNRLGEFVEGLIKPSILTLFQQRGIAVDRIARDIEANNQKLGLATQIDLLAVNTDTCILIEVKSHLTVADVNEHIERLEKFKLLFPEYQDKRALGAVAGMVIADDVAKYAYRKGFFVIGQQGENAIILNDIKFQPAIW